MPKFIIFCQKLALITLFLMIFVDSLSAKEEFLPEIQEKRAQKLFLQVKCLVCEGQVIENSNTQIAFEMRKLIRKKISQGQTDREIKAFLIENYGSQILTSPPLSQQTALLWVLPIIFLAFGSVLLFKKIK